MTREHNDSGRLETTRPLEITWAVFRAQPDRVSTLPEIFGSVATRVYLPQLWDMRRMRRLREGGALTLLVVPQCAFGPGPHSVPRAPTTARRTRVCYPV